ncbi:MAG: MBOAT family O-acyltransferase [Bacteroidia bacterium]
MVSDFERAIPEFSLILPIGISFYTFNSLSYTIDLYNGKTKKARSWLHFMAFISFFPHLVAGPIIRAKDVLLQLEKKNKINITEIYHGIGTCIWGLFQKMVVADNLAIFVNNTYSDNNVSDTLTWWVCGLAFSFQIYFDFNGYSTIARGLAKLCGIHFRLNFNYPYRSLSFNEFWKRWHISLSTFFRDYVYIPLGGNRKGFWKAELNKWLTMLLSGLWHGANTTFLVWGALHALFLSLETMIGKFILKSIHLPRIINFGIVFGGTLLAWVFFRSPDIDFAFYVVKCMLSFEHSASYRTLLTGGVSVWIILAVLLEFIPFTSRFLIKSKYWFIQVFIWSLMIVTILFFRGPEQDFIYFQF